MPHANSQPRNRGYTLIEMLIVMGIILLMVTLVLLSVTSMLRSSRMSRCVSLMVSASDEARTLAITLRRSTRIDRTQLDADGHLNRLTVAGPYFNENFEDYDIDPAPVAPLVQRLPSAGGWINSSGTWALNGTPVPCIQNDGSKCLRISDGNSYWNVGARVDKARDDDFESIVQARIKFLPTANRNAARSIRVMTCIQDAGSTISAWYGMTLTITPTSGAFSATNPPGRNLTSIVALDKSGTQLAATGGMTNPVKIDDKGASAISPTTDIIENVWYRVILSVKLVTDQKQNTSAVVAGKVFADGQLEPFAWTVGPLADSSGTLSAGPGGFFIQNCEGLVDDVLFDDRPIRVIPAGLRLDAMDPTLPAPSASVTGASPPSPNDFPIVFRPDGTAAQDYIIRITDLTSGDKRYVRVDQNTGRSRPCHSIAEALQQ